MRAYLDIETAFDGTISVIGMYRPDLGTIQLVGGGVRDLSLYEALEGVRTLVTFNGSTFDLRPDLGRIDADTLVVTGRQDFICGPAAAAPFVEGIPRAELVVIEDAGHFTFLEQPDAFREAVEAFLSG